MLCLVGDVLVRSLVNALDDVEADYVCTEYAAAFFLLADHLHDAVQVCLNQLKDMQLAITISRVYEGDDGPVLRRLLQDTVLPLAAQEGNRWLAAWAFWMLGRKDVAVRALIVGLNI